MRKSLLCLGLCMVAIMVGCTSKKDTNDDAMKEMQEQNELKNDTTDTHLPENSSNEYSNKEKEEIKEKQEEEMIEEQKEEEKELTEEEKQYQTMIERSLMQEGNNYRIKKVIEKARNGEDVAIAYIGGSITEGANASPKANSYASLSFAAFKKNYGKDDGSHITMVNAGMGGTPSSLGVIRYQRDVLDKLTKLPDIVFIEFAVNDYEEATKGKAYESLVRKVLNAENQPAVILVFSVFQSRWNLEDIYRPLGKVYQLPMVSIKQAVVPALDVDKTLTDAEFFSDIYHPTNYGHKIMADCITHLFETIDQSDVAQEDIKIPVASYYGSDYEEILMIDSSTVNDDVKLNLGSFTGQDSSSFTFPKNWQHKGGSGKEPFSMEFTGKNMLLVFKQSNSNTAGKVDIYLDGELNQTVESYSSGGWNNPIVIKVFEHNESKAHSVTIQMAEGEENKDFTILAIGYSK